MKLIIFVGVLLIQILAYAEVFEGYVVQRNRQLYLDQKNIGGGNFILVYKKNSNVRKFKDVYVSFSGKKIKCNKTDFCISVESLLKPVVYKPIL